MPYTSNTDEEFENSIRGTNVRVVHRAEPKAKPVENDGFDDILRIFNTPEYRARQQEAIRRSNARPQPNSFQNSHGRVSNINRSGLAKSKKSKLSPFKKGVIMIALLGCLGGIVAGRISIKDDTEMPVLVPDGYVQIIASEQVEHGESVYEIASEYYTQDLYGAIYDDINDYVDTIIDTNNLSYDGKINPYDTLSIPVLVDIDDPCYQELKRIEAEIAKIKEEAYWVDYRVDYGDSLSSIAAKASGSYGETITLVNEIMAKNKLSNSLIYEGQLLKIVNPALGQLKISFNEMQDSLFESLKIEETQK